MAEDPLVKAVTGLMAAHHATQQAVSSLGKGLAATNTVVTEIQAGMAKLQASVSNMEVSISVMESSLADEGDRIQALLEAVTAMAHNSTDTQKRLAEVERRLDRLEETG
jgi:septal ring factor EnvC (AmiA/AmiB activator)